MPIENSKLFKFPQLYVVEASAGSGKTWCLARRYLQLLINPRLKPEEIPLNTILAITFTNKAALEMKERILDFLKKIALDGFSSKEEKAAILDSLGVEEEVARNKAARIMDHILKNYNFFQVQTIDSFINTILSGCAFKLDLSANFTTEREFRQYLLLSLDKLIERLPEDKELMDIFRNFLKQYLYLENKAGWFPRQNILNIINGLYSKSAKFPGGFIRSALGYEDILNLKKEILKLMMKLEGDLPEGAHKTFVKSLAAFLEKNKESFNIDDVSDFFKSEGFPLRKGASIDPKALDLWEKVRKNLKELAETEALSTYNCYLDIFNAVLSDLKLLARRDDVLFLEALNKEAAGLFREKGLELPELYWRLATRFEHFLLDEFQDTSLLQWENIHPMIKEALSSSGSLFLVGDKKQAIYRFRGGEAGLVDAARSEFVSANYFNESLSRNFRSHKEIVEFNNAVFSGANLKRFLGGISASKKGENALEEEDKNIILNAFGAPAQESLPVRPEGFVRMECLDAVDGQGKDEAAKEKFIPLVRELKERFRPEDIAVLVRKNEEAQKVTSWLLAEGIAVESETTLDIKQNAFVKELVSFLRFLNSPIDDLAFVSFVTGEIFSRASGIDAQKVRVFLFDLNRSGKPHSYLYREFRSAFTEAWDALLDEFFKSVGFIPLYELAVSILGRFKVFSRFPEEQAYFMRFLELIRNQEEKYPGISGFLEFFDETDAENLYVNSSSGAAVKVLTMHKAKGLEFPVVVVPFLEINVKVEDEIVVADEHKLTLLYLKSRYADFSPRLRQIRSREYLKCLIDELDAVYVALTRAVCELYIFVPAKGERGANIARGLFPEEEIEIGKKTRCQEEKKASNLPVDIPPSEYADWIGFLKDEFVDEGILRRRDVVQRGEILHYMLSFIGNLHGIDRGKAILNAFNQAKARFPLLADPDVLKDNVIRLVGKKELRDLFVVPAGEVFNEKEVVNSYGDTKRIDRLVITAKEGLVIDYKSAADPAGDHQEQVKGYMDIIREIYPKLKIRGILLYLDTLKTEEIHG